jgi:hypothetical protein
VKLYIDNVYVDYKTFTGDIDNTQPLRIGYDTSGWTGGWFDGHMDEVRFYNRALNTDEIQDLYNQL